MRDTAAQEERLHFEAGDLENQALRNKHTRGESAKGAFHRLKLYTLWFGWGMFVALNVTWLAHIILPWQWVGPDNLGIIQAIIHTIWAGKLGMLLERYAYKHSDDASD